MSQVSGRIAVITGAGAGIGRAVAIKFASLGSLLVLGDVNERGGLETVELISRGGGQAIFVKCDVSQSSDLQTLFATAVTKFGTVDIVINNAGIGASEAAFYNNSNVNWKKMVEVNLNGVIEGTQLAIAEMKKSGRGGVIINVSSLAGLMSIPQIPIYAATKAAVVRFTASLKPLSTEANIRVCAICPGFTETPLGNRGASSLGINTENMMQPVDVVVNAIHELAIDKDQKGGGAILLVSKTMGKQYVTTAKL